MSHYDAANGQMMPYHNQLIAPSNVAEVVNLIQQHNPAIFNFVGNTQAHLGSLEGKVEQVNAIVASLGSGLEHVHRLTAEEFGIMVQRMNHGEWTTADAISKMQQKVTEQDNKQVAHHAELNANIQRVEQFLIAAHQANSKASVAHGQMLSDLQVASARSVANTTAVLLQQGDTIVKSTGAVMSTVTDLANATGTRHAEMAIKVQQSKQEQSVINNDLYGKIEQANEKTVSVGKSAEVKLTNLNEAVTKTTRDVGALTNGMTELSATVKGHTTKIDASSARTEKVAAIVTKQGSNLAQLTNQLEETAAQRQLSHERREGVEQSHNETIAQLQQQISELRKSVDSLAKTTATTHKNVDEITAANKSLKSKVDDMDASIHTTVQRTVEKSLEAVKEELSKKLMGDFKQLMDGNQRAILDELAKLNRRNDSPDCQSTNTPSRMFPSTYEHTYDNNNTSNLTNNNNSVYAPTATYSTATYPPNYNTISQHHNNNTASTNNVSSSNPTMTRAAIIRETSPQTPGLGVLRRYANDDAIVQDEAKMAEDIELITKMLETDAVAVNNLTTMANKMCYVETNSRFATVFFASAVEVRKLPIPYSVPYLESNFNKSEMCGMIREIAIRMSHYEKNPERLKNDRDENIKRFRMRDIHEDLRQFVRSEHPQDVAEITVALNYAKGSAPERHLQLLQRARIMNRVGVWTEFCKEAASGEVIVGDVKRNYTPFKFNLNL